LVAEIKDLVNSVSKSGATPMHYAAGSNSFRCLEYLSNNGGNMKRRMHMTGETPVHIAAQHNAVACLEYFRKQGGDLNEKDFFGQTVNNVLAGHKFSFPSPKTGIFSSLFCLNHHTCPDSSFEDGEAPPENVNRLKLILDDHQGLIRSKEFSDLLEIKLNCDCAPISDILRIHEWSYVKKVMEICNELSSDYNEEEGMGKLDGDTAVSEGTFKAALAAVGAVCSAVDKVIAQEVKNAFCPVRPPGHHAGPRGACGNGSSFSHGFCIFNNVAAAAGYAMNRYRDRVRRVAIVDFGELNFISSI
jgi:hypothetical protein